jgi:hypothetical protein
MSVAPLLIRGPTAVVRCDFYVPSDVRGLPFSIRGPNPVVRCVFHCPVRYPLHPLFVAMIPLSVVFSMSRPMSKAPLLIHGPTPVVRCFLAVRMEVKII